MDYASVSGRSKKSCPGRKKEERDKRKKRELLVRFVMRALFLLMILNAAYLTGKKAGKSAAYEDTMIQLLNMQQPEERNADEKVNSTEPAGDTGSNLQGADSAGKVTEKVTEEATEKEILEELWKKSPELILVNKETPLSEDYEAELKKLPYGNYYAAADAYDALCQMLEAGEKEGLQFKVCSAYRSVDRQRELLEEDIDALRAKGYSYEEAYREATQDTMPPGCSEHATGYAFDIVSQQYQVLNASQKDTEECIWLAEHCAEYGFILRYPDGEEEITGIVYEPWHFRFVGNEAAEYIMEREITLEEYLEQYLEEYPAERSDILR